MVKISVDITRKEVWFLITIFLLVFGIGAVVAYNSNWKTQPGTPAVMGHTPDEIVPKVAGTFRAPDYASDWFDVTKSKEYTITHNLKRIVFVHVIYRAGPPGTKENFWQIANLGSDDKRGATIKNLGVNQIILVSGKEGANPYGRGAKTKGQWRVFVWDLENP